MMRHHEDLHAEGIQPLGCAMALVLLFALAVSGAISAVVTYAIGRYLYGLIFGA